jgi:tetratricopeptide (TPR) repeat protein
MKTFPSLHCWAAAGADQGGELPPSPEPYLDVRCHRRLRGPYTAGGFMMRSVVPELLEHDPELVAARVNEVIALAPDLTSRVPVPPQTLTYLANAQERTRFYAAARTRRLAHGVAELLTDWARVLHPGGVVISFRELQHADFTDRELVEVLLRRCDPSVLTLLVEAGDVNGDALGQALATRARRVQPRAAATLRIPAGADLAQLYVDSDCTSEDPALQRAYANLSPDERARGHTARAEHLIALDEPAVRLGAVPYHLERGTDPAGAGAQAFVDAVNTCFDLGFYQAAMDLALSGRQIISLDERKKYWDLTNKVGACLSYLKRGEEAFAYFSELRRDTTAANVHMNCCYMLAMLYTRHLPKEAHDEDQALEWANTAIAIADRHPDPRQRVFVGAFMRNAKALVELHRGNLNGAMSLVNEAIRMTDADLGPDEQLLHRSVLLYNRAQISAALGDQAAALLDYDEVIRRDPDYGDYYFERAAVRRAARQFTEALADYATAIRLSPPFHEAHYNRADLLRELGDDGGALPDLDYALELEPDHVDSLVNRADLLLGLGEVERARADIDHGLSLDPRNAHLLSAQGSLLAESGCAAGAHASYTAALKEDPGFVAAWANRAILSYSAGRAADAVGDLDQAIRLADDPALRANRAIALQDIGEHHRAIEDLDIAIASLGDPDMLYRRGASRYELHDIDGALADWRAHLAAYGPSETSPYAAQIQLKAGDLIDSDEVPESVA